MNKRETALEIIRIEYAKYGCSTVIAMRAYVENHISAKAYKEAIDRGLKTYNTQQEGANE